MPENKIKIPEDTIETVLEPYDQEERYLEEAEIRERGNTGIKSAEFAGEFDVSDTNLGRRTGNKSASEEIYTLCYNQLGYAFFAELVDQKSISGAESLSVKEFRERGAENYFIRSERNFDCPERVESEEFRGYMVINEHKSLYQGKMHFFDTEFDFEDGRASGEVRLALNFRDEEV